MPVIRVTAPSRLHFGMLSFGRADVRQFGGVGAMIDSPGVRLELSPAERLETAGPLADRVMSFAERVISSGLIDQRPGCRIQVVSAPRQHVGLGVGTQLGMAVAAGLNAWCGGPERSPLELAQAAGRGLRSAIGLYGFASGGLLIDPGKRDHEISPPPLRIALPSDWRFLLLCPKAETGLSGEAESRAFEDLPPVPLATTEHLCREVLLHLAPAAGAGDFAEFSESLYRYGHAAGLCFAERQAGAFASKETARLVALLRSLGIRGVAQSSWGPLLCAVFASESEAAEFAGVFADQSAAQGLELSIVAPNDRGAVIEAG
jgi:beta-RFAP synthase